MRHKIKILFFFLLSVSAFSSLFVLNVRMLRQDSGDYSLSVKGLPEYYPSGLSSEKSVNTGKKNRVSDNEDQESALFPTVPASELDELNLKDRRHFHVARQAVEDDYTADLYAYSSNKRVSKGGVAAPLSDALSVGLLVRNTDNSSGGNVQSISNGFSLQGERYSTSVISALNAVAVNETGDPGGDIDKFPQMLPVPEGFSFLLLLSFFYLLIKKVRKL